MSSSQLDPGAAIGFRLSIDRRIVKLRCGISVS
jgi:hypothetical protein